MAVTVTNLSKDLILTFERFNDQGEPVGETRRVRNFKTTALPEDLHEVALMIAALSEQNCEGISMQDVSEITAA
ncbi:DUF1659 domain-containing protein [Proteiniclasticum sp. SCR006]|uniref:DUF1659 domain-containing protein n=1 Tax=Proteiniclasticum aestuarii TaxID=2817862 RepID=A0A939KLR4_9CLOT|nr:DUF1659 domain-containing protein [Proteiniclasticum aestuarii]MBO1265950.1 DUF1659 domain-containing protein [Proteiniclasticum aestuarii]